MKCELCKHEMVESVAMIKVKHGRKMKEFPVNCMRCPECKSVRLSKAQVLEMPKEVTMEDFLAYVTLQERVATIGLTKKGVIKEELPKVEMLVV